MLPLPPAHFSQLCFRQSLFILLFGLRRAERRHDITPPSPSAYVPPMLAKRRQARAFSSEVDTGSREENASKQESRAPFRFHRNGKGSSAMKSPNHQILTPAKFGCSRHRKPAPHTLVLPAQSTGTLPPELARSRCHGQSGRGSFGFPPRNTRVV
jgi:hypothetical protein